MSRWLIFTLFASGLLLAPLSAQDTPPPKGKAKTEPKAEAPKTKAETVKPKTEPPKAEVLDEKTVKERASYAIGINFGKNLAQGIKQDGADVDLDLLLKGIKDALTKAKPAYTEMELTAAIEAFGKALEAKAMAASKAAFDKNKKEGEAYLAENKKAKDVQTTATGLQYKVLKKGDGKAPQKSDTVRVHYHGTLPNGTVFDSSKDRGEPIEFPVTGVIKGWTEALLKMKVGDKWMLYIPSDLAYGPQQRSEAIGPNQVLVFEVELLGIVGPDVEEKKK
ncbi:MAG: FKBP-type peptidyl-prolyl cis-trans isomerase [Pirellulaceae bacterium]